MHVRRSTSLLACVLLFWFASAGFVRAQDLLEVRDVHGRPAHDAGIRLVDWEGHIANPAIKVFVEPTADASLPAAVDITVHSPSIVNERFYFNCDAIAQQQCINSRVGVGGPEKTLFFDSRDPQSFFVSIRPDRDGDDDRATLSFELSNTSQHDVVDVPLHVMDQDIPSRQPDFRIEMDYSRDEDGFDWFTRARRVVARQAAEDWAYYLDDMELDEVPAGAQETRTWSHKRGFHSNTQETYRNESAYTGFLVYPYGIRCEAGHHTCAPCPGGPGSCSPAGRIRSGGAPMAADPNQVQRSHGRELNPRLWRSGIVDFEIDGNFDRNGWADVLAGPRWFEIDNRDVDDLYSIFRHEFGHAFAFNPGYEGFTPCERISSRAIRRYYGEGVPTNCDDHFVDAIDPASLHGAFGNEYHGRVPPRRWLITKLDLLLLEAVGYELRHTTPVTELSITPDSLPEAQVGERYRTRLHAEGGVPIYDWDLTSGLPEGLALDRVTGRISGTPAEAGRFTVKAVVCDANQSTTRCPDRDLTLVVADGGGEDGGNDGPGDCFERCDDARARCLTDLDVPKNRCIQAFDRCLQACRSL